MNEQPLTKPRIPLEKRLRALSTPGASADLRIDEQTTFVAHRTPNDEFFNKLYTPGPTHGILFHTLAYQYPNQLTARTTRSLDEHLQGQLRILDSIAHESESFPAAMRNYWHEQPAQTQEILVDGMLERYAALKLLEASCEYARESISPGQLAITSLENKRLIDDFYNETQFLARVAAKPLSDAFTNTQAYAPLDEPAHARYQEISAYLADAKRELEF